MGDIRVGGYGPGGCTCCISACEFCPIHGTEEHLSWEGRQKRKEQTALAARVNTFIGVGGNCPVCHATVRKTAADQHIAFHRKKDEY